ncbi:RNA polymerase factor sigma-54 [Piscinibacter sakaiensis]|uniref:RNA polymerase sigma-54 factor n=1 Tax=Piscinibacter sakaiensis TaxID=1547922 RepID=A0A0K8P8D0_PISS1|nr:RNA polymerase factor sigma-54 [Piscinibacter sakaiensis]GAP38759.1 RNA polymerase sigma-54 factor RpoN [Piscinibacter sakaiensis]
MALLDLRPDLRPSQALSPRLQHAVRLLQMSSLDFAALLREKLDSNPFLEREEGDVGDDPLGRGDLDADAPARADPPWAAGDRDPASAADESWRDGGPGPPDAQGADERALWQSDGGRGPGREDGAADALEGMAVESALNAHLHAQVDLLKLGQRDEVMLRAIVESLDDDGYLRSPLQDLVPVVALHPPASLEELRVALRLLQSLEPAGVGATSVAECLLLQMPAIASAQERQLATRIVREQLPALAARDMARLARCLGEPPKQVEAACDRIRRLQPRPGWQFGGERTRYIVPDVVVRRTAGGWTVQLNPAVVPRLRINEVYAGLFQRHRGAANAPLGVQLHEARWTLRNVEQRFATILDVAGSIVRRQCGFFDHGAMAMKPLSLREVADEVQVHESTVSRVTNNKYIATPFGTFELTYFFGRALMSSSGRPCSGTAIRELVAEVIAAERPTAPWSDAQIAHQLAEQGLPVARRTVTKYRQMMKIEAVGRRRRLAAD